MGRFCDGCDEVLNGDTGRISVEMITRNPTGDEIMAIGNAIAAGTARPVDIIGGTQQRFDFCPGCALTGGLLDAVGRASNPPSEDAIDNALTPDELDALGVKPKAGTEALANLRCPNCRVGELISARWSCECTIESRETARKRLATPSRSA